MRPVGRQLIALLQHAPTWFDTAGRAVGLVEPRDPSAIALAVVRLLADAELRNRLVQAGQKTADHYSWPRVAQRVLDVYAQSGAAVTV